MRTGDGPGDSAGGAVIHDRPQSNLSDRAPQPQVWLELFPTPAQRPYRREQRMGNQVVSPPAYAEGLPHAAASTVHPVDEFLPEESCHLESAHDVAFATVRSGLIRSTCLPLVEVLVAVQPP